MPVLLATSVWRRPRRPARATTLSSSRCRIAEDDREQASSDQVGDRLIGLASSDAGAVIAPKRGGAIAVDQSEFEQADAAIRYGAGGEGPLISYRLRNL